MLGADGGRAILHVDMDAFYVSVELRRRPELRGKPVVVGGSGRRGVVAAASYEARRYGVFSAMPSVTARRLCPHAVFLPGDHDLYAQVSREVHEIFHSVTPLVEPLALDEAFLDVTGSIRLFGSAQAIADHVRDRVADRARPGVLGGWRDHQVPRQAGVEGGQATASSTARSVPVAACGWCRPATSSLPAPAAGEGAVGRRSGDADAARSGSACAPSATWPQIDLAALVAAVGAAHGRHLHDLSWARDDRPVESDRETKSIGHEETFAHDRHTHDELHAARWCAWPTRSAAGCGPPAPVPARSR